MVFNLDANWIKSTLRESMPSMMVVFLPHFLVSSLTLISCCSILIVPQTQRSLGRPQTAQIAAMDLVSCLPFGRENVPWMSWICSEVGPHGQVDRVVVRSYVCCKSFHWWIDQLATIIVCNYI